MPLPLVPAAPVAALAGLHPVAASGIVAGAWNMAGFTATALTGTHRLTDITGTSAFGASTLTTLGILASKKGMAAALAPKPLVMTACVSFWAARLGTFLFDRILKSHEDPRLKYMFRQEGETFLTGPSAFPLKLMAFWSIQAAWAWVSLLPVTMAISRGAMEKPLSIFAKSPNLSSALFALGFAGFSAGFLIEAVADRQKSIFKADASNSRRNKWCDKGLWARSRHPNYFGEMLVWWSLFTMALPSAPSWTIISPIFVTFLLNKVSGIPLVEQRYDSKYGDDPEYQQYKESTPLLVPRIWKS